MREIKQLRAFLKQHKDKNLVLATIIETQGSTYRKAGAKKLIANETLAEGLISGGCLETDIIKFALDDPLKKRRHTFDTTPDGDRFFGSGVGCQGKITIEFETIDSSQENAEQTYLDYHEETDDLHVIIVGSGLDIPPLVDLIQAMSWSLQIVDYRSHWVEKRRLQNWPIEKKQGESIPQLIRYPQRTALLLMSHNYPFDLEVLQSTLSLNLAYTGVLGPQSRKNKMINDLLKIYDIPVTDQQKEKLFGPMGLEKMGEGETSIALSIVSQLQSLFFGAKN